MPSIAGRTFTPKQGVIGALLVVVGGFLFWLQAGLMYSFASLAWGGYGLQSHLSNAAEGLTSGDYALGDSEFQQAKGSAELLERAVGIAQVDLMGTIPGIAAGVNNWRAFTDASSGITASTGELISLYGDLSGDAGGQRIFSDGAIDLDQLTALPPRVKVAKDQLDQSEVRLQAVTANTIFSQLLDRIRNLALREMQPVQEAVNALDLVAPVLPDALGANGARRYLVAIGNQAEMRAAGGAPLSLVMVEMDNGRISIPIKGQTSTQLFPPLNAPVSWFGPSLNPFFPSNPRLNPFVVTNTHPNLVYSGREMAAAWAGGGYPEVDGVVTVDLTAIAAVLEATGPVQSEVFGEVDGARLGQILLIDAYEDFGQEDADERQEANQKLLDDLLTRLLSGSDLVSAARAMASTAPGRHFQLWMKNPVLEQLALDSGAAGFVDSPGTGDWSAVYTQNGNQSKVDVFQQRNVLVNVNMQEDGSARVTQQVTVTNATPADRPEGPPERIGYETMWLKNAYIMYAPDRASNLTVNYPSGFNVRPFRGHAFQQLGRGWVDDGYGNPLVRVVGWTPPGGQSAVSVSYTLPAGTFSSARSNRLEYILQADPQSLFINSTLTVQVTGPPGFTPIRQPGMIVTDGTATISAVQSGPVNVSIGFSR